VTGVDLAREVQALQSELVVHLVSGYADNVDIDPGHVRLAMPFPGPRSWQRVCEYRDVRVFAQGDNTNVREYVDTQAMARSSEMPTNPI
jgi:hypothetical protein